MPVLYQVGMRNAWEKNYICTLGFRKTKAGAAALASEYKRSTTREKAARIVVVKLNVPEPLDEEDKTSVRRRNNARSRVVRTV